MRSSIEWLPEDIVQEFDENEPLLEVRGSPELRARVLAQTTSVVRLHVVRRRITTLASLVIAYAAGLGTMHVAAAWPRGSAHDHGVEPPAHEPMVASGSIEEAIRDLRRDGDRLLRERGDVEGAMRCYQELLAIAPREERAQVRTEDSWLLVALKQDSLN